MIKKEKSFHWEDLSNTQGCCFLPCSQRPQSSQEILRYESYFNFSSGFSVLREVVHIGFSSHIILQSLNTRIKELGEGQWKHTTGMWHALPTSFLFHLEDGSPERSFFLSTGNHSMYSSLVEFFFFSSQATIIFVCITMMNYFFSLDSLLRVTFADNWRALPMNKTSLLSIGIKEKWTTCMSQFTNSPGEIINFTSTSSDVDLSFILITIETAVAWLAPLKHNVLT